MMETDNPVPPQNGDLGEPQQQQQPTRRRTRFQEAPDEAKSNLPPPGRVNAPGAPPSASLRPPSLMTPPGMRPPAPRPLMNFQNPDENQPLNFFNAPPRNHNNMQRQNNPRPRPGIGYQGGPPRGYPPRGFPGMPPGGMPPGAMPPGAGMPFRPPANPQEKLKMWLELAGVEDEIWVETKAADNKSYYYNAVTRQTVWQKPSNEKTRIVDQAGLQALVDTGMKIERERNPQGGIPPLMAQPGFPGFPMPGGPGMPPRMPMPTDPSLAWQEFTAPDGRKYYFNMITQENTWEKPKVLVDREANGGGAHAIPPHAQPAIAPAAFTPAPVPVHASATPTQQNSTPGGGPAAGGENRPVSSHPVSGTPWCIVWTGDGRVFFYNPTTKTSVWQRPPDLYNRPDVDLLVAKRPEDKENTGAKSSPDGTPGGKHTDTPNNEATDDDDDEDEEDFKAPPKKRTRQEKKQDRIDEQKKAAQKEKKEKAKPVVKEIDPAIEAEIKAKQTRAEIPLEERQKQFREMLVERGVSANSTFQKELSKIVFDSRYLLLSASERKIAFEEYAKERSEIERAEKKAKAKVAKEKFMELLLEAKDLHGKSNFQKFVNLYGKDERFKAVEKNRDREDFFNDYIGELYNKEKEEKAKLREETKAAFRELLESRDDIRRHSKWSHVKKRIDSDPRYKSLDREYREDIFREYVSTLPKTEESDEEGRVKEKDEHVKTAEEKALERRKDEVESELSQQRKERNKEKEMLQMKEEVDSFNVVLKDLIRNGDYSWHDARKILKKDNRYKKLELLTKDEKEDIFKEHIRSLDRKRQETFFQLLNDQEGIDVNTRWKEAKKIIFDDEKYSKLIHSERRVENDFRDWRKVRLNELLKEFKELLRETKIITFESKQKILLNEGHLSDILAVLENDKRYLILKDCPEDRERVLEKFIDELDSKGPPPPPTQTEPEQAK